MQILSERGVYLSAWWGGC